MSLQWRQLGLFYHLDELRCFEDRPHNSKRLPSWLEKWLCSRGHLGIYVHAGATQDIGTLCGFAEDFKSSFAGRGSAVSRCAGHFLDPFLVSWEAVSLIYEVEPSVDTSHLTYQGLKSKV